MPTNLALDDALIDEAKRLGGHKSKRDAVNSALEEYVRRRKQKALLKVVGTVEWDEQYDYKAERRRR